MDFSLDPNLPGPRDAAAVSAQPAFVPPPSAPPRRAPSVAARAGAARAVAVTGFYAAWRVGTGWREVRGSHFAREPGVLRGACQAALASPPADLDWGDKIALPPKSYGAQPDVLRSRARAELGGAGVFDRAARRLKVDPESVGVSFSASKGFWPQRLEEQFFDVVDWLCCDGAARDLARSLGSQGPVMSPVAACATGACSIALGAGWIRDGRCDIVLAGAVERPAEPLVAAGYAQLGALSPSNSVRPFDARRDGFSFNSGMGFLVLEDAGAARARGAEIFAYLAGQALGCDATALLSLDPSGDSIARLSRQVLAGAPHAPVDYINAHGTATVLGDEIEARALRTLFDGTPAVASSTKGLTGHLMGAAGAVEAALCVQALAEGFAPPNLGLEEVGAGCEFSWLAPAHGESWRARELKRALSLSYGFGGHTAALLFDKLDGDNMSKA
jgi:hypothetical protein